MKKIICMFLILAMITAGMVSCQNDDYDDEETIDESDDLDNISDDDYDNNSIENGSEVHNQYENLFRIDKFKNGLATFLVYNSSSTSHFGSSGSWKGNYYYGFVNIKGQVVIEPVYECNPYVELPDFEYNYTKVGDLENHEYIIDKDGDIKFELGKNNITAIGKVSEGYFWVETVEEGFPNNTYIVKYYSADDLSVVATFEDIRAIPDNQHIFGANSTLTDSGDGLLAYELDNYTYYEDDVLAFNIKEYDKSFSPKSDDWNIDLDEIGDFDAANYYYYHVSEGNNTKGQLATVALKSTDKVWYYAVVDSKGNILMQPQKNIIFPIKDQGLLNNFPTGIDNYEFCKDLCPAKDEETGCWGYIDPQGNWKIKPQYSSATIFSTDGYATVNDKIVINTKGNVIISPKGWTNEIVTSLSGTYKYNGDNYYDWYLTFSEDGELKITEVSKYVGYSSRKGTYQIKGSVLIVLEIGYTLAPTINGNGEYSFRKEGDTLIINDSEWVLSDVNLPQ
ncbi:MAG: WG repeat-containing protein [Clostridia bacterium]|nr:WG repeat-containing protein [Clostridia bacterium]